MGVYGSGKPLMSMNSHMLYTGIIKRRVIDTYSNSVRVYH